MNNDYTIRVERREDYHAVENLTREAFWNVYRPGCLEHYVLHAYRTRPEFIPELSLVMEKDGILIGHVMYSKAEITTFDGKTVPIHTFGPISIAPDFKRKGYGTKLLSYSLEKAKSLGVKALVTEGNLAFYSHLGFKEACPFGLRYYAVPEETNLPFFILKELVPGFFDGISGIYKDPEGYLVDEAEAEAFDALFPKKEKLVLPGQLG
jgi:Predicted acetyltransferase